jgi:hypothetical protein
VHFPAQEHARTNKAEAMSLAVLECQIHQLRLFASKKYQTDTGSYHYIADSAGKSGPF